MHVFYLLCVICQVLFNLWLRAIILLYCLLTVTTIGQIIQLHLLTENLVTFRDKQMLGNRRKYFRLMICVVIIQLCFPFIPQDGFNLFCTDDQVYPLGLIYLILTQLIFSIIVLFAIKNEDVLSLKDAELLDYFNQQTYSELVSFDNINQSETIEKQSLA